MRESPSSHITVSSRVNKSNKLEHLQACISSDSYDPSQNIPYFPHYRNLDFVGCEDALEKIGTRLAKQPSVALNGIGGVGFVTLYVWP
jgi:hypothetical protein